jgi:uncharacterized protein with von Willebrand factor type A (vWA) domain
VVLRRFRRGRRNEPAGNRFRYSAWDGTQTGFELDAESLFSELTDDLLYHGDLHAALRRLLQSGMTRDGEHMMGLREILDKLRQERRERLEQHDLGGVYDEINEALDEIVEMERERIEDQLDDARASGDARRQELAEQAGAERNIQLDLLPDDLAGKVGGLQNYDFQSNEARERFEELMEELRQQMAQQFLDQMSGAMQDMSPQDMGRMKDMMAELNRMLEQRQRGEEPDFDGFMDRYGDFFPENPENLDELLEIMARRMAAMQAMMNSMTPEQRAQLQGLAQQLMEDMDLAFLAQQLGQNLQQLFPQMGWDQSYDFSGQNPLGMAEAAAMMQELGELDQLTQLLAGATDPGALADVDLERVRQLAGDDVSQSLGRLAELNKMLEDAGLIEQREGRYELTPQAIRRIGQNALSDLFRKLTRDQLGRHELERSGHGHERDYTTKAYEWGDPFNLHIGRTVRNAIQRTGGGTPVRLTPEDFEVERTEQLVRTSTVLMLDLSLSMPMRDNFLPAKKVAMALHSLISSQYPRDFLGIVGFSETARTLEAHDIPEVSWDFVYGTNMQHGFLLARQMLARQSGTKQILMITDGEPTAHLLADGSPYFAYPPVPETIEATLAEVMRCTREGIRINTFMLDATSYLRAFVERMTEMNGGRAFFTTPETLGDYVLVDFVEHRRKLARSR